MSAGLSQPVVGRAVARLHREQIPSRGLLFNVSSPLFTAHMKAQLYFGLYESAEIRFVKRELVGAHHIIELGSSLGITGSFALAVARDDAVLVCVEPSPELTSVLRCTLEDHRRAEQRVEVIAGAISYGAGDAMLAIGPTNISSALGLGARQVAVPRTSLREAFATLGEPSEYHLICDIEGAEHELLDHESDLLQACQAAVIECHDGPGPGRSWHSVGERFVAMGFAVAAQRGPVIVVRRA